MSWQERKREYLHIVERAVALVNKDGVAARILKGLEKAEIAVSPFAPTRYHLLFNVFY